MTTNSSSGRQAQARFQEGLALHHKGQLTQAQPPGWTEISLFALACYSYYNAALLVALLLSAEAVMATKRRSRQAWGRLLALGLVFLVWVVLSAHSTLLTSTDGAIWQRGSAWNFVLMTLNDALAVMHPYWLGLAAVVLLGLLAAGNGRNVVMSSFTTHLQSIGEPHDSVSRFYFYGLWPCSRSNFLLHPACCLASQTCGD